MMALKKNSINLTFRVIKNGKMIQRCSTHSIRRFRNKIGTINWEDRPLKVYLRVSYGKYKDCFGKMSDFYNDGYYTTKRDLIYALQAFTEKDLIKEFEGSLS